MNRAKMTEEHARTWANMLHCGVFNQIRGSWGGPNNDGFCCLTVLRAMHWEDLNRSVGDNTEIINDTYRLDGGETGLFIAFNDTLMANFGEIADYVLNYYVSEGRDLYLPEQTTEMYSDDKKLILRNVGALGRVAIDINDKFFRPWIEGIMQRRELPCNIVVSFANEDARTEEVKEYAEAEPVF